MEKVVARKLLSAHEVKQVELDARSLSLRLLDAVARLFSPYL